MDEETMCQSCKYYSRLDERCDYYDIEAPTDEEYDFYSCYVAEERRTYTLKEVCDIAMITAEDLENAPTPEIG